MTTSYDQIEALNWSTLRHLATSARLLRWRAEHPQPDSRALQLGRAIHCAVLEPERFATAYVAEPDFGDLRMNTAKAARAAWLAKLTGRIARPYFDVRRKEGKAARAAWLASLPEGAEPLIGDEAAADVLGSGVETLAPGEHELAARCAEAVRAHPVAAELLRGGRAEETIVWTDEQTGIPCKARVDYIAPAYLLDLKSGRADSIRALEREFAGRLYHGQLAFYHDGAIAAGLLPGDVPPPYVIFVQTIEPYDVVPARMTWLDLDRGRGLYSSLLERYAACRAADWWPGLAPSLIDLSLPAWTPSGDGEEVDW